MTRRAHASLPEPAYCFWLVEANFQPIGSTTHDLGNDTSSEWDSALVSQSSFGGKHNGGVSKCRLFSQVIIARDSIFFDLKTFANKQWKFPMFPMLWKLLYSLKKRGLLVADSMLNLERAFNLSVRLSSTGLALRVRLHFRTCSHLLFVLFFAWKRIKIAFFRKALTSNQKKKLLVNLLLFFGRNR